MAPPRWVRTGPASPETPVTFFVAMPMANVDKMDKLYWEVTDPDSPKYRDFLTRDQVLSMTRPSVDIRSSVRGWLEAGGAMRFIDHSDAYEVHTTARIASSLLNTEMHTFEHTSGRTIVRQWGEMSVPDELRDSVVLVAGLSEFPIERRDKHRPLGSPLIDAGIVPQTIQTMYGTPSSPISGNASQGVIEWEGQGYSASDLSSFSQSFALNLPALKPGHVVGVNGGEGTEGQLDIEYVAAVGLGNDNWYWLNGGQAWLYGFATQFLSRSDVPNVVSMSYGWSESDQCEQGIGGSECQQLGVQSDAYVQMVNQKFQAIGLRGVSLFASSGDSGANGRTDEDCISPKLNPTFPAASPFVTAVGATQLNNPQTNLQNPPPACSGGSLTCASGGTEVAVSYQQAHFASGGGFSNVAARPKYQESAVSAYLNSNTQFPPASYFNKTGRAYPDIAGFGSNVIITANGALSGVGGTSCSSPITAGLFALINAAAIEKDGKPLGPLNPLIYKMAAADSSTFNDITVGDNKCTESGCGFGGSCKGYEAAAGFDTVTGLGSPNYQAILSYVQNNL